MESGNVVWQIGITYPAQIPAQTARILFGKIGITFAKQIVEAPDGKNPLTKF